VSCYVSTRAGLYSNVKIWKTWKERKRFHSHNLRYLPTTSSWRKTIFFLFLSFLLGNILCHENDPDSDSSWNRNSLFDNCSKQLQSMKLTYLVRRTFIHFIIIIHSNCPINHQYWILFLAKLFSVIEREREKKTIITLEKLIINLSFYFLLNYMRHIIQCGWL
jgi:hypothetical protein